MIIKFLILIILSSQLVQTFNIPEYTVTQYNQTLDHFNFETPDQYFNQRVLIFDQYFLSNQENNCIFFYTGNELDITNIWNNTGFMHEIAPQFNALIVMAEHRYYGQSLPFGQNSFTKENIGFLSVEQALADFAEILVYVKNVYGAQKAATISFGGSYGGMLTAWFRIKYPHIVDGGIAASAPILMASGIEPSVGFWQTVTNDAQKIPNCVEKVRKGFSDLVQLFQQQDLDVIKQEFQLCNDLKDNQLEHLVLWIQNAWGTLAMVNYPYGANFLAGLPKWPFNKACNLTIQNEIHGEKSSKELRGIAQAASLFYNATGDLKCFDIYDEYVECSDQTGCGNGLDGKAWDYQACTEIIYYPNTNNITDMFVPRQWTLQNLTDHCNKNWGITPRPEWMKNSFGANELYYASNLVFSNGDLDPWMGGGFLENINDSLISILIKDGAHHLDLRASDIADPQSVIDARNIEIQQITKWIKESNDLKKNSKFLYK